MAMSDAVFLSNRKSESDPSIFAEYREQDSVSLYECDEK